MVHMTWCQSISHNYAVSGHFGTGTLRHQDTSDWCNEAEVSRHFGTGAEVSNGQFGTGTEVSVTFSKWNEK